VAGTPYTNWEPIGTSRDPFIGSFDGDGHKISNLIINRSGKDIAGLFGYTAAGAMIQNLGLEDFVFVPARLEEKEGRLYMVILSGWRVWRQTRTAPDRSASATSGKPTRLIRRPSARCPRWGS
jgi:hypothetical protein